MTPQGRHTIDLNCDLGEGGGHDAALMPLVSSVKLIDRGGAVGEPGLSASSASGSASITTCACAQG